MAKSRILLSALAFTLLAAAGMPARAASKPKITHGIVTSFDGTPIYYNLFGHVTSTSSTATDFMVSPTVVASATSMPEVT